MALPPSQRLSDSVITVTRPTLPDLEEFGKQLEEIWASRWLTNDGPFHKELEHRLAERLGVENLSLFCNGTIALLVALQTLRINSGEVITTPFTFPATAHVLHWNRVTPVFCDIEEESCNIDPSRIEELISPDTKAILAVHVYGTPCDCQAIQAIADKHGLHVIYDAAHAFGVELNGIPILRYGDLSVLSFHATKLYTTVEGGALISRTEAQRKRVNFLRNFGIADEETVVGPGINGKMNELQAAFGLLTLKGVEEEIRQRLRITEMYRDRLDGIPGIRFLKPRSDVRPNGAYFPIFIDPTRYGVSRNDLHAALKRHNILTRKYFYPLCSHYSCYSALPSSAPSRLPVAEKVAENVLCLPIYGTLEEASVEAICNLIRGLPQSAPLG